METRASIRSYPGFKFSPTEQELILCYLRRKIQGFHKCDVIAEIDIVGHEPWDLPEKSAIPSNNEWYFFSPRGRKYPKGLYSRIATQFGYWKATGKQRDVKSGTRVVGSRRTLVFHKGGAPTGRRTEWIMHEYCMTGTSQESFVVCRVRNRKNSGLKYNLQHINNNVEHMDITEMDHFYSEYDDKPKNMVLQHESCISPEVSCSLNFQDVVGRIELEAGDEGVPDDSLADILNEDTMMVEESSFENRIASLLNEEFMDHKFEQLTQSLPPATSPPRIIIRSRKGNKPREPLPFRGTAPRRIRMQCEYVDDASVEASGVRDELYQNVAESAEFPRCFITKMLEVTVNHRCVTVLVVVFLLVWCFWLVHEFRSGKL